MIQVKNSVQLNAMKEAGRITGETLLVARELVRPGISTKQLDDAIRAYIEKCGAKPSFLGYHGFPGSACISINDEVIHGIPSAKRFLQEGDIVKIDVGAFINGHHGDSARTIPVGKVSDDAMRLIETTRNSFFCGVAALKVGNRIGDVGYAIQSCVEKEGFSVVRKYIGHGIGRDLHESPDVPNYGTAGRGVRMMQDAGVEVVVGVMEDACKALNKRFFCLQEKKRPYVILKWAQTADGYIDLRRNEASTPLVISTPLLKQLVHQQRAENMAIMVGTRTVLLDNPRLLTTHWSGRNPVRVTLDRHGVLPTDSRIFSDESETITYRENSDWQFILNDLAQRNIHSILVEGGAALLNTILESGVYDEVHVEVAKDVIIGSGVKAPDYVFKTKPQVVDGHLVYVEKHLQEYMNN